MYRLDTTVLTSVVSVLAFRYKAKSILGLELIFVTTC